MSLKKSIKKVLAQLTCKISKRLYINLSYLHNRGKLPNIKHPTDLSEIIYNEILSGEINKYTPYVDKLKVREFIEEWGYSDILPKVYGIYNKFEDIDFSILPEKFAIKTNHGCGGHCFCIDKSTFDIETARTTIEKTMNTVFGTTETQYHTIKPKIYCEEFIEDKIGQLPTDYKFMCCDGIVKCILIVSERNNDDYKLYAYSVDWEPLDYIRGKHIGTDGVEKPVNFDRMLEISKDIAKKFPHVRVDLYDSGDRIYFGELTFTPQGGIMSYFTNEALVKLGHFNN